MRRIKIRRKTPFPGKDHYFVGLRTLLILPPKRAAPEVMYPAPVAPNAAAPVAPAAAPAVTVVPAAIPAAPAL